MERVIVAIGGTGQVVLHRYLQLYLLGEVREPFQAVVLDTDDLNRDLRIISSFLDNLQVGTQRDQALGETIPRLYFLRVATRRATSACEAITSVPIEELEAYHPARAMFSEDVLRQEITQGLYARPALSCVLSSTWLDEASVRLRSQSQVVVIASLVGGTGGGLCARVISDLYEEGKQLGGVTLRAVLFGHYFDPDEGRISGGRDRFISNQMLTLRAVEEVAEHAVQAFAIVGGPDGERLGERDHQREKTGAFSPWPTTEADPFWQGTRALDYLLSESIQDRPGLPKREVDPADLMEWRLPDLRRARAELEHRLGRVRALVERPVIPRMSHDPFATLVWGDVMVRLLAGFWRTASEARGGLDYVAGFPREVQRLVTRLWRHPESGLRGVFPKVPMPRLRVRALREVAWPEFQATTVDTDLFRGKDVAAERTAATMLFWALRG